MQHAVIEPFWFDRQPTTAWRVTRLHEMHPLTPNLFVASRENTPRRLSQSARMATCYSSPCYLRT